MANIPLVQKACDDKTRNLVNGFVRNIGNTLTQIIPINIIHICLSYYFIIEQWMECGNKYISISSDGKTIKNDGAGSGPWDTAYGTFEIDCDEEIKLNKGTIFEWIFYIHNYGMNCISLGIDETERRWINTSIDGEEGTTHYTLNSDSQLHTTDAAADANRNRGFKTGDTVIMQLNVKERSLTYYKRPKGTINSDEIICEVKNIKITGMRYCIASYLWRTGCVEIKEFNMK